MMTSNLASEEIANHALDLRREAKEAAEHREEGQCCYDGSQTIIITKGQLKSCKRFLNGFALFIRLLDGEISEKITISRKFKERVVQPILKVSLW